MRTKRDSRVFRSVLVMVLIEVVLGGAAATVVLKAGPGRVHSRPAALPATTPRPYGLTAATAGPVLTLDDLGPGWLSVPLIATTETGACFRPRSAVYATEPAAIWARSWVTQGIGLPTADEVVAGYRSGVAAGRAFEAVAEAMSACARFAVTSGYQRVEAAVTRVDLPPVGEQSISYQVSVRVGGTLGGADFVLARRASDLMLLVYGTVGQPDRASVAALDHAAVERLSTVG